MLSLCTIGSTAQQVAEAISAVLEVETEILAGDLTIVAGTGKYRELIGSRDEEVNYPDASYLYTRVLKTGRAFVVEDPGRDPFYGPVYLGETGEICCPIHRDNRIIGIIALVAFNEEQRKRLLQKREQLQTFLQHMAFLLASRVAEMESYSQLELTSGKLSAVLESIHEGIIAVDRDGMITHCNRAAEKLVGKPREEMLGSRIDDLWPDSPLTDVLLTGQGYRDREELYGRPPEQMHLLVTATPIMQNSRPAGVVASFRNMAEVRSLAYQLTGEQRRLEFEHIKGISNQLAEVKKQASKVAQGSSTVLIRGESGTGKELFARAIHHASPRRDRPFVIVNCGAIPETLLESELFGYEEGAFTGARRGGRAGKFELAEGGTIFLDEIGDLPLHLQVKLLHVLQRRQVERVGGNKVISVNVRVIAATHRNLEEMCARGEFREDLYYRLNVIPLEIPPLRERREDIEILMEHFLNKYCSLLDKRITGFEQDVYQAFITYHWPGNVRELENAVEYAVNMEAGPVITLDSVPARIRNSWLREEGAEATLKSQLINTEKEILAAYLQKIQDGTMTRGQLAKLLGISRITLYRKIKEYGL
ncbi:PAS domain-containing protein [Desulfofundulus thermobenzoicus]|uniref:PAS domain-containing protein n=1 Tax=Desulfofundulus thermobenzoicus TaxID=29376 RepID=A0A6N7IMA5_9FIRM|nr:sigma 54-interacting transcriptional regulator [Desulfofundulus thermobenzoicus]MQL50727.1 PAS domain-containing protein [Desulfofundulus thermobenzoicus]